LDGEDRLLDAEVILLDVEVGLLLDVEFDCYVVFVVLKIVVFYIVFYN